MDKMEKREVPEGGSPPHLNCSTQGGNVGEKFLPTFFKPLYFEFLFFYYNKATQLVCIEYKKVKC